jgi:hypothetical protein
MCEGLQVGEARFVLEVLVRPVIIQEFLTSVGNQLGTVQDLVFISILLIMDRLIKK